MNSIESLRARFAEAVVSRGRRTVLRLANPTGFSGFDPVAGHYVSSQPREHTVEIVPVPDEGRKEFANRFPSKFSLGTDYELYTFGTGEYTPMEGDAFHLEGTSFLVTAVEPVKLDGITAFYQVGMKRGS